MITNDEEQRHETSFTEAETHPQNQLAVPTRNDVVRISSGSSSSDEWSTTSDEDDGNKQVAENGPQISTENGLKIINTYENCEGVSSTVHNTNIYKDGVTINQNVYCCPSSLDYVLKSCATKRGIVIFTISLLGFLLIILLGVWLSNLKTSNKPNDTETETTTIISTTEKLPPFSTVPPTSTDSTTSSTIISTSTDSSNGSSTETPIDGWKIMPRKSWGAEPAKYPPVILDYLPPIYVIFRETQTEPCTTTQECMEAVRKLQALDFKIGRDDISYNFLVGGDGMVYEGRGWDVFSNLKDYDTGYFDDMSISVSFIGKFDVDVPTDTILRAAKTLLRFGVKNQKLVNSYKVKCLKQLSNTLDNPGKHLFDVIKTWEGWDSRTIESFPPRTYDYHDKK